MAQGREGMEILVVSRELIVQLLPPRTEQDMEQEVVEEVAATAKAQAAAKEARVDMVVVV